MSLQHLAVAAIVTGASGYATLALMPAAWRRALALRALRLPWPAPLGRWIEAAARRSGGCGCKGCDAAPPRAGATVHILRRPTRR